MAYQIAIIPMTLSDLQCHSLSAPLQRWKVQLCWQDLNWHGASRGHSATAELLS